MRHRRVAVTVYRLIVLFVLIGYALTIVVASVASVVIMRNAIPKARPAFLPSRRPQLA